MIISLFSPQLSIHSIWRVIIPRPSHPLYCENCLMRNNWRQHFQKGSSAEKANGGGAM
jgi:hypothetical protein